MYDFCFNLERGCGGFGWCGGKGGWQAGIVILLQFTLVNTDYKRV
jgi:hypothetical protein